MKLACTSQTHYSSGQYMDPKRLETQHCCPVGGVDYVAGLLFSNSACGIWWGQVEMETCHGWEVE